MHSGLSISSVTNFTAAEGCCKAVYYNLKLNRAYKKLLLSLF